MDTRLLWEIPGRTLIVYGVILIGLRLFGKRQMGQMTPTDLVLLLLILHAVQNAMTGPDTSVLGGVLAAAVLLLVNSLIGFAGTRARAIRLLTEGQPTTLIEKGRLLSVNLKQEEPTEDELLAALREHGIADTSSVALATLEADGSISVVPSETGHLSGRRRSVRFIKPAG